MVAARLNGRIDFLRLETYNQGRQIDWGFMSAYRRSKHFEAKYLLLSNVSFLINFLPLQHIFALVQREVYQIPKYPVKVTLVRLHRAVKKRCVAIWSNNIKDINS